MIDPIIAFGTTSILSLAAVAYVQYMALRERRILAIRKNIGK